MIHRVRFASFLLGLIAAAVAGAVPLIAAPSADELTALFTQVDGAVQVAGSGVRGDPLATPWQVIRSGVAVRLPKGATAGIVCSSRRFVRLRGPLSWTLSGAACAAGKELTPGEYAIVAPQAGRFKVVDGLQTLEREIRGGDGGDPLTPLLLAPRNTVLRSPRPTVSWQRLPGAVEYRVEWTGHSTGYETRLNGGDLSCKGDRDGGNLCSLPWPADRPDLAPDEIFFLRIAAHGGLAEPWHWTEAVEVHTQKVSAAETLEGRLRDLSNLGLAGPALDTARAGLLAQGGLYADAAEAYRRALTAAPTPELRVTLGDVYLTMGLFALAEPRYREAAKDGGPSVQAAAAFGIGRIEYARAHYREAAMDFRQAQKLYGEQASGEEEAAARRAAERAAAKSSQ
jgi:hypothetical protein